MGMSTPSFNRSQQQHHHRPANPRLRFPPPPPSSYVSTSGEPFSNQLPNSHWTNSERNTYPVTSHLPQSTPNEQQVLTTQLFQKNQLIPV